MNFSIDNLLTIREILADVLVNIDDEATNKLNEKYYYRQIRQVLDDINFTTLFHEVFEDIDVPDNLQMILPKNMWNIKEMWLFNTTSLGNVNCCAIENGVKVYHKYNYLSEGKGMGHTPIKKQIGLYHHVYNEYHDKHWYNMQGGIIYLSENCSNFKKLRIVSNGLIGGNIYDLKIIPPFIREAVVLRVCEIASLAIKGKAIEPQRYRQMWADFKTQLYTPRGRSQGSVWDEALYRLKKKDKKELEDLQIYLSQMNF